MSTAAIEDAVTADEEVGVGAVPLPLGVLVYDDGLDADRLLAQCARALAQSGYRLAGAVQSNTEVPGRRKCAMSLRDLTSGEEIPISSDLGDEAEGCRLDTGALARASLGVELALADGADLLIINKFGKQEAQGQGFRAAIAEALLAGTPVVLGVSRLNLGACVEFAGGAFTYLEPDHDAIVGWCQARLAREI